MCKPEDTWQEAEADQQEQWKADVHQGEPGHHPSEQVQEVTWDDQECATSTRKGLCMLPPPPSRERHAMCKRDQDTWQEAKADQQDQWEAALLQDKPVQVTSEEVQEEIWDDQAHTMRAPEKYAYM